MYRIPEQCCYDSYDSYNYVNFLHRVSRGWRHNKKEAARLQFTRQLLLLFGHVFIFR